ncbi:MAG: hypothetical protein CMJ51_03080 [Planctomycetaceae bacterium]|nr:hypothetical protein [Planctomycetaceae bacterium]
MAIKPVAFSIEADSCAGDGRGRSIGSPVHSSNSLIGHVMNSTVRTSVRRVTNRFVSGAAVLVVSAHASSTFGDTLDLVLEQREDSKDLAVEVAAGGTIARQPYGAAGSWEASVSAFGAAEFGITEFLGIRAGLDWYAIDRFSLGVQVDLAHAWVGGEDSTVTVGLAPIVRWHFLEGETWTVFGELGGGIAWNGSPIPPNGTRFVFTPQAALGATFSIAPQTRLRVAVGWFHMSNARTSSSNPGLDAVSLVAGLGFSF